VTGRSPLITVAVATCGRPAALERCLAALERGTRPPDALVVVDQASDEGTRRLVEGCQLPRPRYAPQPRLGLAASRNLALELSTTSIIAFTDDDCVPEPGWIEGIIAGFARDPTPAVVTGPVLSLGPETPGTFAVSERLRLTPSFHTGRCIPWHAGSGGNFAARRDVLVGHTGWDTRLGTGSPGLAGEDVEFLYRLMRAGVLVAYEPAAVVRHERQGWARRLATRYSYSFGIGAFCGLWLRRGDRFAVRMALDYTEVHARGLARGLVRRRPNVVHEHLRGLWGIPAGILYGLTATESEDRRR
jgi:GT2 family glycosyltransferase